MSENLLKSGGRNDQKANEDRVEAAKKRAEIARAALRDLKSRPINFREPDYEVQYRIQQGILKKAIFDQKRSENHSRKSKGGRR